MKYLAYTISAVLAVGASAISTNAMAESNNVQPNVLLVLTDNTGWGDWGPYNGGALRGAPSPNVNALAKQGMTLQNFNTEAQCTPSRSALMTGRLAVRSGTQSVPIGVKEYGLLPWEVTMAELLSDKGYSTAIYGKWHLGRTEGRWPTQQGFDDYYGVPNSTDDIFLSDTEISKKNRIQQDHQKEWEEVVAVDPDNITWVMKGTRDKTPERDIPFDINERKLIDNRLTEKTLAFMEKSVKENKPFFAYVPLTSTHFPSLPSPEFEGKSGHGDYTDKLMEIDHHLGQMMQKLDDLKVADNTIVIFASDNGPESPHNGAGQYNGSPGPWAGTYFTAMEGVESAFHHSLARKNSTRR
ncbi:sulfatase-like hydrolase/transferase [Vibrio hannami]|uniref:sulfatase-like hydrolase/transferase n=1 Tax=Vibrio hannami TaxID=2717094 RepID=UPI00240FCA6F|nr:sulfatase-like hydrolase/transferase [Vibrio hannami]MDG3088548.1 sulfatase-like hydrolase/transferase [Vibrio hannami]